MFCCNSYYSGWFTGTQYYMYILVPGAHKSFLVISSALLSVMEYQTWQHISLPNFIEHDIDCPSPLTLFLWLGPHGSQMNTVEDVSNSVMQWHRWILCHGITYWEQLCIKWYIFEKHCLSMNELRSDPSAVYAPSRCIISSSYHEYSI